MGDGIHDPANVETNFEEKAVNKASKDTYGSFDKDLSTAFTSKIGDGDSHGVTAEDEQLSGFITIGNKISGVFDLLRSPDCNSSNFCGEALSEIFSEVDAVDTSLSVGKRNRQDSCNSAVNELTRKANKKSRKKHSKKQELDEEIEKIMADIEMGSKASRKTKESDIQLLDEKSGSTANVVEGEKASKKKKKKKNRDGQTSQNVGLIDEERLHHNGIAESSAKQNDKSEVKKNEVKLRMKVQKAELDNATGASLVEESTEFCGVKKDRKGPGKKQLALIQAALEKAQKEEQKRKEEELARQKRVEEAERLRLEQLKLEEERKLRKKQKDKEKRERLKADGKILTKAQKLARIRTEASITFWREQAGNVPRIGEKKSGRDNSRQKHNSRSSNSEDDASLHSLADPGSSEESLKIKNCPEETGSESSDVGLGRRSRHSSELEALNENHSSNNEINRRFQSDLTLNASDLNTIKDGVLQKSKSLHCIEDHSKHTEQKLLNKDQKVKSSSQFRSPVVCVLGHVDTGKTKILDNIRKTHVQASEAGGITQQIGATMVPRDSLKEKCSMVNSFLDFDLQLPGLLIIDTPGHESFHNLRTRGSSLCDIAILVVDIMHGLEPQTIESINLLKDRKTPFIVALNKIDRLYGWQSSNQEDVEDVIKRQSVSTRMEFDKRFKEIVVQFANQNLNVALFYENSDPRSYVSMVPVSAITGDGMGNTLALVCQLTQNMMPKRLIFTEELEAIVLEVKITVGLGTTIDVILVNGRLREGDTIILAGQDGPVVSQIRSILMPQPLKELRVKNPYVEYKEVKGAQGVKVSGRDLDKVIAGLPLYVAQFPDQVHSLKEKVTSLFCCAMNSVHLSERGVYVQASTLGSLEALLEFLKSSEIPYAGIKVGPVVKKDVIKASVMLEHDIQYAVILAFDVKIEKDAQELAENLGIKIFQADIIYHLFDNFVDYREKLLEKRKTDIKKLAVFPCKLRILPEYVFNVRDPIVIGVHVEAGVLKIGTPLCVPSKNALSLGSVTNIKVEHQVVETAKCGDEVCIKIEPVGDECPKTYGKQFDGDDLLVSKITRQTIDICKEFYRKDLSKSDWQVMVELKSLLSIT